MSRKFDEPCSNGDTMRDLKARLQLAETRKLGAQVALDRISVEQKKYRDELDSAWAEVHNLKTRMDIWWDEKSA